ncbi:GNAT family N-acetyltransferase [Actinomadura nitritigenes]|uniref:GNAT family N-acetyltransferase n=1 Tax=Actinomadura nitritigenes TaxID=134602 RepID=UPI003D93F3B0
MIGMRDFDEADAPALVSWVDGPAALVMWSGPTGFTWPLDRAQLARYAAKAGPGLRIWTFIDEEHPAEAVAHASLTVDPQGRTARLGRVLVDPAQRGRGIGAALVGAVQRVAFDDMGVHRLGLGVFAHNSTAVALYERLGFVREGLSREVVEVDGAWWSSIEMSMLDREWHGRGPGPGATTSTPGR